MTDEQAAPPTLDEAMLLTLEEAMLLALEEAEAAAGHGDVPIGAVVLDADGAVLARRHNEREVAGDPTAHAEILALRDAAAARGGWRLDGATVVSTLEPCPMCAGALVAARVARLVFGAADPKAGACGSLYNLCVDPRLNHEVAVVPGVGADRAARLLADFFAARRGAGAAGTSVDHTGGGDDSGGDDSGSDDSGGGLRPSGGSGPARG